MTTKICSACRVEKDAIEFAKHATRGLQPYCRPCSLEKSRAWAAANKAKKAEHKRNSRHADIERDRETRRRHYANNAEALRDQSRNRSAEKRAQRAERQREYRRANPEKTRQLNRARVHSQRAAGRVTREMIEFLIAMQRGCCAVCKRHTVKAGKGFHLDHKQALASGGTNAIGNLQLLCPTCNLRKSDRDPVEFMQSVGYLL